MEKIYRITAAFGCLFLMALAAACSSQPALKTPAQAYGVKPVYDYPVNNPYAATIITVPPEMKVDYSALPKPREKRITLFKDRAIPEGFWYQDGLRYGELLQPKPAVLVYVIGGTGADNRSGDSLTLANILYAGGFSVVLLPSPTHPNFIINASTNYTPGSPWQDSQDIYRLMQGIDAEIAQKTTITGHMLAGYSLGAWDAAFTSRLDEERRVFRFSRVLLINPPLSLYSSMQVLDHYLYSALPHGIDSAGSFIKGFVARLSNVNQSGDALDFTNERLLIEAYNKYQPSDARLATTIGLSFRLAAVDMIFTSDVMSRGGYVFPKNQAFTTSTSLDNYLGIALRTNFRNYMDDVYIPRFRSAQPGLTKERLIAESSLESISDYIEASGKFRMITNKDDIILAPGELNMLVKLFGDNAVVFPNGGHMGNLGHPAVAYQILQFMQH